MRPLALLVAFTLLAAPTAWARSTKEWKSRAIYQIITDRFALDPSVRHAGGTAVPSCVGAEQYCGGTFAGIASKLDYITGMGFDAIWISPVVANVGYPNNYHGYAASDLYTINPYFGGADGLRALVQACHAHNPSVWVMVDVVANHMGIPPNYDYSSFVPFNSSEHYHDCSPCSSNCWIQDYTNQQQVELCRLAGLPDLNQDKPYVNSTLLEWVRQLVSEFDIDGLRVDTVPEVRADFWPPFVASAGVHAVGEVFSGDWSYTSYYQQYLPAVLSYPLFFGLLDIFARGQSMTQLSYFNAQLSVFHDPTVLSPFLDNHDNPRFLSFTADTWRYKAGLTYTALSLGIPIIYYGTEQGYSGASTPDNRLPLWLSGFDTSTDLYTFLATLVGFRRSAQLWQEPQIQAWADDTFFAFMRGDALIAVTNVGGSGATQYRSITFHPYAEGTRVCNIFWPGDCVTVTDGQLPVYLLHGESKVFVPAKKAPAFRARSRP